MSALAGGWLRLVFSPQCPFRHPTDLVITSPTNELSHRYEVCISIFDAVSVLLGALEISIAVS